MSRVAARMVGWHLCLVVPKSLSDKVVPWVLGVTTVWVEPYG